jgi:hypothetical protein
MECRVSAMRVVFVHGGKEVASHERLQGRVNPHTVFIDSLT